MHPYASHLYHRSLISGAVSSLIMAEMTALVFDRPNLYQAITALIYFVLIFFVFMVLELRDFGEAYPFKELVLTLATGVAVVKEGKAKILVNKSAIPGKWVLTNQKQVFLALRQARPSCRWETPLSEISPIRHFIWKFPFLPGFHLITQRNQEVTCMVPGKEEWKKALSYGPSPMVAQV